MHVQIKKQFSKVRSLLLPWVFLPLEAISLGPLSIHYTLKKMSKFSTIRNKKKVEENISIWQGPLQSNHLFTYHCLYKEDDLRRGSDHLTCSGEESLDHTYTLSLTKHLAALIAGEAGGTEDWWPSSGKEGNYGKSMRRKSDRELCVHREDHHPKTANRTDLPVSKMKMRRDFEFSCGIKRERG